MSGERDLTDATLRRMLRLIEPEWELRGATPAEGGFSSVHRLVVGTPAGTEACFLKASPDGERRGIPADARVSAVLRERTSIPVPEVLGVVDDHAELPSPFYLAAPMPGEDVPYEEVGWLADGVLRTVARQVGAHLGELHSVDAVESFGYVDADGSKRLSGGRPAGTADELAVVNGNDSWRPYLRRRIEYELDRHGATRFSDLTPRLEPWCRERVEALTGPFPPVLGRNDHGFHNLLVDPDAGDVTAMLDWAYTLAVTPAFDFEYAVYLFSGAYLSALPDVRDRRDLVREAMLAGYRESAPALVDAVETPRPLYELLATLRVMNDFEQLQPRLPEGSVDAVADELRREVELALDGNGR